MYTVQQYINSIINDYIHLALNTEVYFFLLNVIYLDTIKFAQKFNGIIVINAIQFNIH